MWKCLECGRKFKTTAAAERASNHGCPGCGGVDIDLDADDGCGCLSDDDEAVLKLVRERPGIGTFEVSPRRRGSLRRLKSAGLSSA